VTIWALDAPPKPVSDEDRPAALLEICELLLLSAVHLDEHHRDTWLVRQDVVERAEEIFATIPGPYDSREETLFSFFYDIDTEHSPIMDIKMLRRYSPEDIYLALGVVERYPEAAQQLVSFFMSGGDSGEDEDGLYRNALFYGSPGVLWLDVRIGQVLEDLVALDPNFVVVGPALMSFASRAENSKTLDFEGSLAEIRSTLIRLAQSTPTTEPVTRSILG
jgi:hypothetical protein